MPARFFRRDHSALTRVCLVLILSAASTLAFAQTITEFTVPTPTPLDLYSICLGPDGAIWFGEARTAKLGRITTDGVITEFSTQGRAPYQIATGPDGNLWFADGDIGRLTPTGQFTEFLVRDFPSPGDAPDVVDITTGPDGALWFAGHNHTIGRITTTGTITYYSVQEEPYAITLGPDGNLWYAAKDEDVVGRVTPAGVVTTFKVPGSGPVEVTAGADGAVWFAMRTSGGIGRISTSGEVTKFAVGQVYPFHMTAGPDGNLWFPSGKIYRLTPQGALTSFDAPPGSNPLDIAAGSDGNIWFTEQSNNKIGRLNIGTGTPLCSADEHTLCLNNDRFAVIAGWQKTPLGPVQQAHAVRLTDESGYFWFLEPGNIEVVVKVLNACVDPWNTYWVFAAGLTNLGVTIDVVDTQTLAHKMYSNLLGTPFQPILDVSALSVCP
jgi:streptogramin lyase